MLGQSRLLDRQFTMRKEEYTCGVLSKEALYGVAAWASS